MASIPELYTRQMHEEYHYLACWLPSTRMALGDVGLLSQHMFKKLTTLAELGIPFTRDPDSPVADLSTSTTAYTVVSSTARVGGVDAEPANNLSITFSRSGATLFQASGCVVERIGNLPALDAALRTGYAQGTWRLEYVVVNEVLRTGPTAVFVAKQRGATLDLRISASEPTGLLPVASTTATSVVTARSGIAADVLAPDGATPLFKAMRLRKKPLSRGTLVFRSDAGDESDDNGDRDAPARDAGAGGPTEQDETQMVRVTWADLAGNDTGRPDAGR